MLKPCYKCFNEDTEICEWCGEFSCAVEPYPWFIPKGEGIIIGGKEGKA